MYIKNKCMFKYASICMTLWVHYITCLLYTFHSEVVGIKLRIGCVLLICAFMCISMCQKIYIYRVFIKYCVFSLKGCNFLNSASSAAALVFYLPLSGPSTHRGKTERGQSPEYILKFSKKKHNS